MTYAFESATKTRREGLVGRPLLEAFPENPDDPFPDSASRVRASLEKVIRTRVENRLPLQRYDIPRPGPQGGGFEPRFWDVVHTPVLAPDGEVVAILVTAQDVTERTQVVPVVEDSYDVASVRETAGTLARKLRFDPYERTALVTAVSELATNIRVHARTGRVTFAILQEADRQGIEITFEDQGQGIRDLGQALETGYSSVGTLGLGLSGSRNLVDDFEISSQPGKGTRVTIRKWAKPS